MKSSNIGGQAVLEGIMMKHKDDYAVAVRKPNGEIVVEKDTYQSIVKVEALTKTPFIRGVFNFIDSMVLGIKTLTFSASFFEEEEEVITKEEAQKREKQDKLMMGGTVALSIVLAVGIFMVLPYLLSSVISSPGSRRRPACELKDEEEGSWFGMGTCSGHTSCWKPEYYGS